jgi:hypothetical protein
LFVNCLHLRVGKLRLSHAIQSACQNSVIGLIGVKYVGQSFLNVVVDSH